MDVSQNSHAEWKNPETRVLSDLFCMKVQKMEPCTVTKSRSMAVGEWQGLGGMGREDYKGEEVTSEVVGTVMSLAW